MEEELAFYEKLGGKGLSSLTSNVKTRAMLKFLKEVLPKKGSILDVACGYGRLSIPLQKAGYIVEGIDIMASLINIARGEAKKQNLKVSFKVGDMRDLPYNKDSFDAAICVWSSFNHMLTEKDQVKALKEMNRVVRKDGVIVVDLPYFARPTKKLMQLGNFVGKSTHLFKNKVFGKSFVLFLHTKESLLRVIRKAFKDGAAHFTLKYKNIGGRRRLILFRR
jgi:ubiquinone/menaquinone biosynthesis C-methylase UbiE